MGVTVTCPGQRNMDTHSESHSTFASERSFEMEDFSPPESPEAGNSVVEDHGGPEPSLFEPSALAPALPEAGSLGPEAMQVQERMDAVSES